MEKFKYISSTSVLGEDETFKVCAISSPNEEYSVMIKFFRNNNITEGEYKTSFFPNFFSDVFLYIRKKDNEGFISFKYEGVVWIKRETINNIRYDDIMNIAEICTDVQNEWNSLLSFCK